MNARWTGLLTCVLAVAGTIFAPSAAALDPPSGGDPQLIVATQAALADGYHNKVSVAYVDVKAGTVRYAHFGSQLHRQFEIGSISKTFLGHLFAQAIARNEVTPEQTLGTLLPIGSLFPSSTLTLRELATHRSGLPTTPSTPAVALAFLNFQLYGTDPYPYSYAQLLDQSRLTFYLPTRGQYQYSNMGAALMGNALAKAAGTSYAQLLRDRMFTPLGMSNTSLPEIAANLPANAPTGTDASGVPKAAWTMNSYAPAGGIRSDIADMATYAQQVLLGTVPGADALEPKSPDGKWGWFWGIGTIEGEVITNHTGGTGGFRSAILLDRKTGKGVVVLSDTAVDVGSAGLALLLENGGR